MFQQLIGHGFVDEATRSSRVARTISFVVRNVDRTAASRRSRGTLLGLRSLLSRDSNRAGRASPVREIRREQRRLVRLPIRWTPRLQTRGPWTTQAFSEARAPAQARMPLSARLYHIRLILPRPKILKRLVALR